MLPQTEFCIYSIYIRALARKRQAPQPMKNNSAALGTYHDHRTDLDIHLPIRMMPSIALAAPREAIRRVVEARRARVFGSVVHGDDADGSDLDILVDALARSNALRHWGHPT